MNNAKCVTIVCVYNNKELFEKQLLSSLMNQDVDYEIIGIDNNKEKFSSAAEALNAGALRASADIVIFSHQDIFLKGHSELSQFVERIKSYPVGTILGAAGAKEKIKTHFGTYTSGPEYKKEYREVEWKEMEVSCIDECFFGMKKETFLLYRFNEELCSDWHLYGVELSLQARKRGFSVYVLPVQLHHFSYGRISIGYMRGLQKIVEYYHKDFDYIWTTCFKIPASPLYMRILFLVWYCNRKLRRIGLN